MSRPRRSTSFIHIIFIISKKKVRKKLSVNSYACVSVSVYVSYLTNSLRCNDFMFCRHGKKFRNLSFNACLDMIRHCQR